jgi:sortase (surface protein transpeptidase)
MTLTTCHPKYSARQRYIVYSVLESVLAKTGGARPPALGAG